MALDDAAHTNQFVYFTIALARGLRLDAVKLGEISACVIRESWRFAPR